MPERRRGTPGARLMAVLLLGGLLAGCATNIHPRDETIQPSKAPLGGFATVAMRPLMVEAMEGDSGDIAAVRHIEHTLRGCMLAIFPGLIFGPQVEAAAGFGQGLLIEPDLVALKKVGTAERIWVGPMAGSSAVLLRLRFTDAHTKVVLAEPVFYSKASAWGGAFSFGASDNAMLSRLTSDACQYSRRNL